MSTIKHNQYNDAGEIIGTFDMPVNHPMKQKPTFTLPMSSCGIPLNGWGEIQHLRATTAATKKRYGTSLIMMKRYALNGWSARSAGKNLTLPSPVWMAKRSTSHCKKERLKRLANILQGAFAVL